MNRNLKILLILVASAALVYFLVVRKPWTTLKVELKDFAVKDTASITKFFLADKRGHSVVVSKNEQGIWMVDNTFKADVKKVNLLLATMHDITIRNPISEKEFNTVIATLATEGVKVEFYAGEDKMKTIYVGPASADQTGTFMMVEGSSAPFITHIDGFVGYLSPRFYANPIKWKSNEVFNLTENEIASVKIVYPQTPSQSFEITNGPIPTVKGIAENNIIQSNAKFVKFYLGSFGNLFFEGYDEDMIGEKADSIFKLQVFCIIEVTQKNGVKTKLQLNYKEVGDHSKTLYNADGKLLPHDADKYFGFINNERDVVYIQEFNFGKILKTLNDFKNQQ